MRHLPIPIFVRAITVATIALLVCNCAAEPEPAAAVLDPLHGSERIASASAPAVPSPITRDYATRVLLDVEVREETKTLADGVTYTYWTFGGETPAKFLRVREGDLIEVHFHNHPDNTLAHNIDFHAATGPGGGGEASFVAPGHSAVFSWRALRPGLFLYHCVAAPAGLHIANGMYGQILVEPKGGLPRVDREFQIAQGEFYTEGSFGDRGNQRFSLDKALKEQPEYVVFNGQVGALMGVRALKAKAGERVRIFLGNAGPSLLSSFHVVGEIFDDVYGEGGILANQHNVQTTVVPVGGSAIVEFEIDVPGDYTLVDHSMFRAFNRGAMGMLKVEGRENVAIFSGKTSEAVYAPGTRLNNAATAPAAAAGAPAAAPLPVVSATMTDGAQLFATVCAACHQANGQGLPNLFPPLAQSDFLAADRERAIQIVMRGMQGTILVNGQRFNGLMPNLRLTDEQIASVLSYVLSNFGNQGAQVTREEVARVRQTAPEDTPIVASESWADSPAPSSPSPSKPLTRGPGAKTGSDHVAQR